jgi:hypothetical protein
MQPPNTHATAAPVHGVAFGMLTLLHAIDFRQRDREEAGSVSGRKEVSRPIACSHRSPAQSVSQIHVPRTCSTDRQGFWQGAGGAGGREGVRQAGSAWWEGGKGSFWRAVNEFQRERRPAVRVREETSTEVSWLGLTQTPCPLHSAESSAFRSASTSPSSLPAHTPASAQAAQRRGVHSSRCEEGGSLVETRKSTVCSESCDGQATSRPRCLKQC